jgi:hypothetical protein
MNQLTVLSLPSHLFKVSAHLFTFSSPVFLDPAPEPGLKIAL